MNIENLVEIILPDEQSFLKIKETLTRIGYGSKNNIYQSCHILQKRGKYYIVHFKELFMLDGKKTNMDDNDIGRRNSIIDLLLQWNLIKLDIVNIQKIQTPRANMSDIRIIPFAEKSNFNLIPKYTIGKKTH